ncbi:hypothetical protein [Azohydromonas australica]|uniref:hypothetical protein n=1 Tax=Azohydromonas australica TaxID=364039 RepID=UPI000424186E|nr:hypothetical protein [Azohydromonas australica]
MPNKTAKNAAKDESTGIEEEVLARRGVRKRRASAEAAATAAPAPIAHKPPSQRTLQRKLPTAAKGGAVPALMPVEADAQAFRLAGGPMAVGATVKQAGAATPPAPLALKPLGALGVDEGVFVLLAIPAAFESVEAFARYAEEPLPHLLSATKGSWLKRQSMGGAAVYVAFVPWPHPPAGLVQLGCITAGGRKPVFSVECLRWGETEREPLAALLKRYGRLLVPAFDAVLPAAHPLRKALAPAPIAAAPAPTGPALVVRGHFDGVVDELAHGWVFCPEEPERRLSVEVLCESEVVGRGLADRYRDDLQANHIGDGQHHFRLQLSNELFDGRPHELSVRVLETGLLLPGRSMATLPQRQPTHIDLMPRAELLALAQRLAQIVQVRNSNALNALLQALRTASLLQETGQCAQARAGYERLMKALGPNALCYCRIAETWLLENDLESALKAYQAAVQADAQLAWAHLGLGNVLRLQGQPLEADTAYRAALACQVGMKQAHARLAQVGGDAGVARAQWLLEQGDRQGAVTLLTAVLIAHPEHPQTMACLENLLREPVQDREAAQPAAAAQAHRSRRLLDVVLDEAERRLAERCT